MFLFDYIQLMALTLHLQLIVTYQVIPAAIAALRKRLGN